MEDSTTYVARIRWQSEIDPDWEIDTRHGGFESWNEAAAFANGLVSNGAQALLLRDGKLSVQLVDGTLRRMVNHDVDAWRAERAPRETAGESVRFARQCLPVEDLSGMGLDGRFRAVRFGVDDVGRTSRITVRIESDTARGAVRMSAEIAKTSDDSSEPDCLERLFRPAKA